jgi:hypothetical protein
MSLSSGGGRIALSSLRSRRAHRAGGTHGAPAGYTYPFSMSSSTLRGTAPTCWLTTSPC